METALARLTHDLLAAKHIGLDTMCFIYQFSKYPAYSSLTYRLFELINQKKITSCTSMVSVMETFVLPERLNDPTMLHAYENVFLNLPGLTIISVDWQVSQLTAKLRAHYPTIRLPDAIQLAAAILTNCSVFLTNDEQLRQVKEIKVKILKDYLS